MIHPIDMEVILLSYICEGVSEQMLNLHVFHSSVLNSFCVKRGESTVFFSGIKLGAQFLFICSTIEV
jgi:hypothetical protein